MHVRYALETGTDGQMRQTGRVRETDRTDSQTDFEGEMDSQADRVRETGETDRQTDRQDRQSARHRGRDRQIVFDIKSE